MSYSTHQLTAERLAMSVSDVAKALDISTRHTWKLLAAGQLPDPIRLGRSVRWPRAEIEAWVAAGAPPREQWAAMRKEDRA